MKWSFILSVSALLVIPMLTFALAIIVYPIDAGAVPVVLRLGITLLRFDVGLFVFLSLLMALNRLRPRRSARAR